MLKANCASELLVSNSTFAFAGVECAGYRESNRVAWHLLHIFFLKCFTLCGYFVNNCPKQLLSSKKGDLIHDTELFQSNQTFICF